MGTVIYVFALLMVLISYIMIDLKKDKDIKKIIELQENEIIELKDRIKKLEQQDFN